MKKKDKLVDWAKFESKRFEILQTNSRLLMKETKEAKEYMEKIKYLVNRRRSNKAKQMISFSQIDHLMQNEQD